jgi:hypothetical protein
LGKLDLIKRSKEKANAKLAESAPQSDNPNGNGAGNSAAGIRIAVTSNGDSKPVANSDSKPIAKPSPLKIALASKGKAEVHDENAVDNIADIGSIDMDTVNAVKPTPAGDAPNLSNYIYEGQAETADERATEAFYEQLKVLEESIGSGFAVDNITIILKFLDEHSFLKDILKPEEIGIMVRGLRSSYGTALANASVRRGKKKVVAKEVDDVMDILTDIGI